MTAEGGIVDVSITDESGVRIVDRTVEVDRSSVQRVVELGAWPTDETSQRATMIILIASRGLVLVKDSDGAAEMISLAERLRSYINDGSGAS